MEDRHGSTQSVLTLVKGGLKAPKPNTSCSWRIFQRGIPQQMWANSSSVRNLQLFPKQMSPANDLKSYGGFKQALFFSLFFFYIFVVCEVQV